MSVIMIAEKPTAAKAIAAALAEKGTLSVVESNEGVKYYEFRRNSKHHIIVAAVGHLFTLKQTGKGWEYPVFDVEWIPSFKASPTAAFSKKYYDVVEKIVTKGEHDFIVCCDYDEEGCLPENEKILAQINGVTHLTEVGELVERQFKKEKNRTWERFEYCEPSDDIRLPMIDKKTLKLHYGKVKKLMKRQGDKNILKITAEHGRTIQVSKNHPMLILTPTGLTIKKASELEGNEYIPIVKNMPFSDPNIKEMDLIEECISHNKIKGMYIYGFKEHIKLMPREIAKLTKAKRKTCVGWRFFNRIPLWAYLKIEKDIKIRKYLKIGPEKTKARIPIKISLDSKLGRLVGYYLAEGCCDTSGFVGLYFGPEEKDIVNEVECLFTDIFGVKPKRRCRKVKGAFGKSKIFEIGTKSKIVNLIFKDILNLGTNSHNKKLPDFIFSTTMEFYKNIIDTYLVGDGSAYLCSKDNRYIIAAGTASKELVTGLHILLLRFGVNSSIIPWGYSKRTMYNLIIGTTDNIEKLLKYEIFSLLKRKKIIEKVTKISDLSKKRNILYQLPNFILNGCEADGQTVRNMEISERTSILCLKTYTPLVQLILNSGIHFFKIREIEEIEYNGLLYDFETESGNFMHGNGIITHNSVIGYNILRFMYNQKDAKRMKFSTMTKEELIDSYNNMMKHLDTGQVESGLTRHYLDYMWGISLTRALTLSIKSAAKRFRILSTGRVQGPVLHMLAKHEKKIKAFKPKPFWQLEMEIKIGKRVLKAVYCKDKLWDKDEADKILKKADVKEANVKDITKKIMSQNPPKPYNTTSMLADIYRYFGYSPQQGMSIAETLYQSGMISYPRTSSEKLPPDINYKKIITSLSKQEKYKFASSLLAKKELKPTEGKKADPAHPAIYPTGVVKKIGSKQQKIYDLVVHRFLAVFGDPAKRESQKILLSAGGEIFHITGKRTIEPGWTALYGKYAARDEIILPDIKIGDKFGIKKLEQLAKETSPPPRFSQGSVLKEMENQGLGTKATRAQILQILYNRGYLIGRSIEVTELGLQLSNILESNISDVISERLTRHFEEECDAVQAGKIKREEVMDEAKDRLTKISNAFRKKEAKIGKELTEAVIATQDKQNILGTCPKCGGTLKVHKMWKTGTRFVGCSGYKKGCRFGMPLPREGLITSTDKICEECKTPIIQVYRQGARPFRMCIDINCPTKKDWLDEKKLKKARAEHKKAKRTAELLTCDVCNKAFKTKRALTLHKKTHEK